MGVPLASFSAIPALSVGASSFAGVCAGFGDGGVGTAGFAAGWGGALGDAALVGVAEGVFGGTDGVFGGADDAWGGADGVFGGADDACGDTGGDVVVGVGGDLPTAGAAFPGAC